VPAEHLMINRHGDQGEADYVDIVQVALLQTLDDVRHPLAGVDHSQVSAFDRLGLRDSVEEIDMTGGVVEEIGVIGGVIEVEEIKVAIR
jgi:hypothetical protein